MYKYLDFNKLAAVNTAIPQYNYYSHGGGGGYEGGYNRDEGYAYSPQGYDSLPSAKFHSRGGSGRSGRFRAAGPVGRAMGLLTLGGVAGQADKYFKGGFN